jgi:sugar-specific transcriptional regulator TrmB
VLAIDETVIERLRQLGFSLYEARIYVALLKYGPQNGNELSKASGVPSSKVYAALEKLSSEGVVQSIREDGSVRYVGVSADDLVDRLERRFSEPIDYLRATLPEFSAFSAASEVLTLSSLDAIRHNSRSVIDYASNGIYVSLWARELDDLRQSLKAADARGVSIVAMLYGEETWLEVGSWLHQSYLGRVSERVGGRMLILIADSAEAVIAHIPRRGAPTGIRTKQPTLCLIAQEYLRHEIVRERRIRRTKAQVSF